MAPENMPTATIERFIDTQEREIAAAKRDGEEALSRLTQAIRTQQKAENLLTEYKGWLWSRENKS